MFGEVGVVTTKERIQAKLSNGGTTCMFVGYAEHHSSDVYRMLNLTTNSIINSRDIIWLKKITENESIVKQQYPPLKMILLSCRLVLMKRN
jgi:hypothetical protein